MIKWVSRFKLGPVFRLRTHTVWVRGYWFGGFAGRLGHPRPAMI